MSNKSVFAECGDVWLEPMLPEKNAVGTFKPEGLSNSLKTFEPWTWNSNFETTEYSTIQR